MFQRSCLPYVSAHVPGIGGVLKASCADFEVTEIPAYMPSGQGEHFFLYIEKTGVSADALMKHLAQACGVDERDIGTAGLKDTYAITRQWVSLPKVVDAVENRVNTEGIRVLSYAQHPHKLRTGHVRGNRFKIRITQTHPGFSQHAQEVLRAVEEQGFFNLYGEQRFGKQDRTLQDGLRMLLDKTKPVRLKGWHKRLALSAVQSALFNETVARRVKDGCLHTLMLGDVMQVSASGGPFVVEDVQREQARYQARETVLTGPMFGPKMRSPQHDALAYETQVLHACGFERTHFEGFGALMQGTRRPVLVWPEGLEMVCDETQRTCELSFTLPSGSYATVLADEWIKGSGA